MKINVISYSFTGNNDRLASSLASALGAEHLKIIEPKPRKMTTIFIDLLFNRTPPVQSPPDKTEGSDLILFFAPVWFGQVATPLRSYFNYYKTIPTPYVFISISGGADGGNPKLANELKKRMGRDPKALIDLHIADLLPRSPKPERKDTAAYQLTERDLSNLTDAIMKTLRGTIIK
ncbi:MAG: hypothetical protein SH818_15600 [Saprospiraceae bacterium]|nr:hypothetical protein [Saprospiraceae bacterium]